MRKVLVFPGCTGIGLEIYHALRGCKEVELYSATMPISNHAPFVFKRHFSIPGVENPGWLEAISTLVNEQRIDYIFPAHDLVIMPLLDNADQINAQIVCSPKETCIIIRSKLRTYSLLGRTVPVPRVFTGPIENYPVFVKPDRGMGSQGVHIAWKESELALRSDDVVLEYLPGAEYTVDCFSDREAGLLFCEGRERVRIRNGIAWNSRTVKDSVFREYGEAIAHKLEFHGAWHFQLKRDRRGTLVLLEVSPRIAGTMATHRVQGVNFPLLSLWEQERVPINILTNDVAVELDRDMVSRYKHNLEYSTVYVDLDDTLILRGEVNIDVVRFLYQCVNNAHRIVLLTRHLGDLAVTLQKHHLSGLFDEEIWLPELRDKADYIDEPDAILIDDGFRERQIANQKLGIATFDSSMIELLLDERV